MFDWVLVYFTLLIVFVKFQYAKLYNYLNPFCPKVTRLCQQKYLIEFTTGSVVNKLIVQKQKNTNNIYVAIDQDDNDVTDNVLSYIRYKPIYPVTPFDLGYDVVEISDINDNTQIFDFDDNILL